MEKRLKKRRIPLAAITILITSLLAYYLLIYVPQNEDDLRRRGIRRIATIAANIQLKHKQYQVGLDVSPREYFLKWYLVMNPSVSEVYVDFKNDSVIYSVSQMAHSKKVERTKGPLLEMDPFLKPGETITKENPELWEAQSGNHHLIYSFSHYKAFERDSAAGKFREVHPQFWGYLPGFIATLDRDDFFDDIFLATGRGDTAGNVKEHQVLNTSKINIHEYEVPDSVLSKGPAVYTQVLAGEEYAVFHQRVKLSRQVQFSVVALVSEARLSREARSVPTSFLIICVIGLLLVLLSWPMLKLFLLNKQESLKMLDVNMAIAALVLSVSVVTILIIGLYSFFGSQKSHIDKRLERLSMVFHTRFLDDIKQRVNLLKKDDLFEGGRSTNRNVRRVALQFSDKSTMAFNEIFNAEISNENYGRVKRLLIPLDRPYPDFFNTEISVGNRVYFVEMVRALKGGAHIVPYVESVKSRSTGKMECAVSIPYTTANRKEVRVITSPMPSVINSVFPAHYTFAVINKSGVVQFHSDQAKIQSENFFDECAETGALFTMMKHEASGHLDLTLNHQDYRAHFSKLYSDLYLVTLYRMNESRSFMTDVFTLSLITTGFFVLYLAFLLALVRLDVPRHHRVKMNTFFYRWLNPFDMGVSIIRKLILFNLFLLVCELVWLSTSSSTVASVFFSLLCITASCFINYVIIRRESGGDKHDHHRRRTWTWFTGIAGVLLAVFALLMIIDSFPYQLPVILMMGLVFLALIVAVHNEKIIAECTGYVNRLRSRSGKVALGNSRLGSWHVFSAHKLEIKGAVIYPRYFGYRLFLFIWIAVTAILPSSILFKNHYAFESVRRGILNLNVQARYLVGDGKSAVNIGTDYGQITQPLESERWTLPNYETINQAFYQWLPVYWIDNKVIVSNSSGSFSKHADRCAFYYLPDGNKLAIELRRSPGQYSPDTARPVQPPTISRAEILPPGFEAGSLFARGTALILLSLTCYFLWTMCYRVPAKIFYMPVFYVRRAEELREQTRTNAVLQVSPDLKIDTDDIPNDSLRFSLREQIILKHAVENRDKHRLAWASCSTEEKQLLLDLAEDGVANQANHTALESLEAKKLITIFPYLKIREASFADFVTRAMTQEEREEMEEAATRQSGWHMWRLPIILLAISLLAFVSLVEEGLIARIGAILASVGLLVPHIVNIGASVGKFFAAKASR